MRRWAPVILLAALTCACGNRSVRIESSALADQSSQSVDRLIIAAVNNDPAALMARAGSTPRGYNAIARYGPTSSAIKTLRSLEADFGLREVSAWPIEPLHMHCAVLELADGVDRPSMLTRLSADPRIKLAQPMQTFSTRTQVYNDPYVELQRGLQQMGVVAAQAWSRGGGVKVAIIDTGVDTEHSELRGRIA